MKKYDLLDAIGNADDELVKSAKQKKHISTRLWATLSSVAACLVLLMIVSISLSFFNIGDSGGDGGLYETVYNGVFSVEDLNRPYKDISVSASETAYVWKWNEKTVYEQYYMLELNGNEFLGQGREIDADNVGERLGKKTLSGTAEHPEDFPKGTRYKMFEVYEIKNVSPNRMVAVLMEGKYYVFRLGKYNPPSTFGEALDEYGLSTVLELNSFTKKDMDKQEEYYRLTDDAYIWEILSSCRNAEMLDADNWNRYDRNYIGFTVTSDALGVYKKSLIVTDDGYLWTNAFDYAYLYNIGTDAAEKIISHARSNSVEAKSEPFNNAIVGTVVEITDEYMLVNDGILCENPNDGISFKIMLNDVRISRYVTGGAVGLNATVRVEYEGKIDVDNGYVIYDAISAFQAVIGNDGAVLIPE